MRPRRGFRIALCLAALLAGCGEPPLTYKALKLVRPPAAKVSDADVRRFIDQLRVQAATARPLDPGAPLARGDRATIDFVGTIDGVAFPGGTASGVGVVLGSGRMIPGFEDGIVGMREGDAKTIKVTFPRDYQEASLAGRPAQFRITVRRGESLTRPPLDDAFAGRVSGGQIRSAAELRRAVRQQIVQQRMQQTEQALRAQAADAILAQWKKSPSNREVNRELDRLVQAQLQNASQRGAGPAQGGPDAETIRKTNRPAVERSLRISQAFASIAKREKIAVTDADVEQMATQMAQAQGQDPKQFLAYVKEQKLGEVLRRRLIDERVVTLVLQSAQIEDAAPPQR